MKWLLILLAFAGSLVAAEYHPSLPAIGSLDGLGVNIHFTDPQPGELEMIKAAGFKWVRMDLTWAATERERGTYDFGAYDRLVAGLEKNGLRAVFILDYGNKLYDEGLAPHTEEGRAAFAKWAAAAVARYAGKGFLWELWNEPNIAQFWKPKPDVQQYIALVKAACAAIHAAAPKEALIGPATSKIDLPFLEECFKAGLLEHWCAVSVHPYRQAAPETVEEEYRSVRLLIRKHAPKDKTIPVLSGEWGYSTAWKEYDEEKQAKYLARMFLTNIANDVPLSIWYDWRDDGDDPKEGEHRFGIVRRKYYQGREPVFDPKPAYRAARTLTAQLAGMSFNKRLSEGPLSPNRFLLFKTGGTTKGVTWSANPDPSFAMLGVPLGRESASESVGVLGERSTGKAGKQRHLGDYESPNYLAALDAITRQLWLTLTGWKRLPLEYVIDRGDALRVEARFTNPLEAPVRAEMVSRYELEDDVLPDEVSAGAQPQTKSPSVELPFEVLPSESLTIRFVKSTRLLVHGQRVQQRLTLAYSFDPPGHFHQWAPIILPHAISAEALPAGAKSEFIRFREPLSKSNPGSGLAGSHIFARFKWNETNAESEVFEVPLNGEGERLVTLKRPSEVPSSAWLSVFAKDSGGELVFAKTLHRGTRRIEIQPDGVSLVFDGDPQTEGGGKAEAGDLPEALPPGQDSATRFAYAFAAGWKFMMVKQTRERLAIDRWPRRFGMWLHGDRKSCQARIRFTDSSGQTFQADGPKIDWKGWRYVTFPMQSTAEESLTHWGGANDGVIHYPIRWDTIFLLDNVSREPIEGEIYLSAPTLIY